MKNTNKKEKNVRKGGVGELFKNPVRLTNCFVWAFFAVVWGVLAFWESDTLFRVSELSLFLFDSHYFHEAMALPAGFLSYIGTFFVQFFHYPALGAAIYVLLLIALYRLTKAVFKIPGGWGVLALLPVVAVLACSTQMGYWIFYLKIQGFWYIPLLGVLLSLAAVALGYKIRAVVLRALFAVVWVVAAFPFLGVYALGAAVVMALSALVDGIKGRSGLPSGIISFLLPVVAVCLVPCFYYKVYGNTAIERIHFVGTPVYQWVLNEKVFPDGIIEYWVPFILIIASFILLALLRNSEWLRGEGETKYAKIMRCSLPALAVLFTVFYWYGDNNFRIENSQNRAMWNEDWEAVAAYAKNTDVPTRQIVLNRNIALLKLGRAAEEAFTYPDGSADIDHPGVVHLVQTGGLMNYFQYGKFNFCYRWCIENSVEYGWRLEYLKHATRSALLSGQHKLAMRYIKILKNTLFYRSWAGEMEKFVENPSQISKDKAFTMPLLMYNYDDVLDLDDSYVEVYLSKSITAGGSPNETRLQCEAAVIFALTRKDVNMFWGTMSRYLSKGKIYRLPRHFQEAVLLFTNLSSDYKTNVPIDPAIKSRFNKFLSKVSEYKGMTESEMAPHFVEEFGDTYWYFYFFVREIKTN